MRKQDQYKLLTEKDGGRTVWIIPVRGWVEIIMDVADTAQTGDKVIVGSLAQEKHARHSLDYRGKADVVVERGSSLVRFDADVKEVDPKEAARQIMEHLRGVRAKHRGESGKNPPTTDA